MIPRLGCFLMPSMMHSHKEGFEHHVGSFGGTGACARRFYVSSWSADTSVFN